MALISSRTNHAVRSRKALVKALMVLLLFLVSVSFVGVGKPLIGPVYATPLNYTLTEWTIPTPASAPTGLTLDPQTGNCCWFVEASGNKVGYFDPAANNFQEWPIPTPASVTTGLAATTISGMTAIWGAEFSGSKIFVFFPSTGVFKEYPLAPGAQPEYISVEPPSSLVRVWFNEFPNKNGEIAYDPSALPGAPVNFYEDTFPPAVGGATNGVYAGPGNVYYAGAKSIVKWDRVGNQYTIWPLPVHGTAQGDFLALDSLGQVWYTEGVQDAAGADNYVGVVRGDNTIKEWQIPSIGADPREISISPSTQSPWIAENSQNAHNGKIAVLDPSAGGAVIGAAPTVVAAGVGSVLITPTLSAPVAAAAGAFAPVSNPNTGSINGQFTEWSVGNSFPHDVVADSAGNVWIAESGANKIARLTPTAPDFTLSPNSPTVSIPQGGSGTVTITGTSQSGFSGPVTLSPTGAVPAGVTFSAFSTNPIPVPSGGSASASLTINVAPSAAAGTSPITISGTGASGTHTTSFALTITSSADFSLALSSPTLSVGAGGSTTDTITITSIGSFNSAVALSASSLPAGAHVMFSSPSVTPPAGGTITSVATVSVDPGTLALVTSITITGTSGSLIRSQPLALTITVTPDFSIGGNPTSIPIVQGASGTSTITVTSTNGFSSAVALSYSWIGSAPSGVSVSLPGPVTPTPGTPATSTLTVSASSLSSTGSFTLSVTGTSGVLSHSDNLGILISAAPTTTSSTTPPGAPKCLIATATYGSELAPEVQLLRNFRDNSIMKTASGSSFMIAFNAWYYSFSPYVANYLTSHWVERTVMKGVLYPLIGMLYLTSNLYAATATYPELAALLSGLLASSLIGAFYLGLPLSLLRARVRRLRGSRAQSVLKKLLGTGLLVGMVVLVLGEIFASPILLMTASALVVLSSLFLSATLTSAKIAKRLQTRI